MFQSHCLKSTYEADNCHIACPSRTSLQKPASYIQLPSGFSTWTRSRYFKLNMSKNEFLIILPKPASSTVFPISVVEILYFQMFIPKILKSFVTSLFLHIHFVDKIYLSHPKISRIQTLLTSYNVTTLVQDIELVWIIAIIS